MGKARTVVVQYVVHSPYVVLCKTWNATAAHSTRPGIDDDWESVFDIVAFSFVFDNYCLIMV